MRRQLFATVAAVLLVASAVGPFVGLASASTVHEHTYTDTDVAYLTFDLSDVTGEARIQIYATFPGGAEKLIFDRTKDPSNWATTSIGAFKADKAGYESYRVQITTSSGTPTFSTYGYSLSNAVEIGATGGDWNMDCSTTESIADWSPGNFIVDCNEPPDRSINITQTDANETEVDIYESGAAFAAGGEVQSTTFANYLNDTKNQALVIGKAEYIRELNNGTSKSVAESRAKQAVADYYSQKQLNIIQTVNASLAHVEYLADRAENETGVSNTFVNLDARSDQGTTDFDIIQLSTHGMTLSNGTSVTTTEIHSDSGNGFTCHINLEQSHRAGSTDACTMDANGDSVTDSGAKFGYFSVLPPTSSYEEELIFNTFNYRGYWNRTEELSQDTQSQIETFSNATYDAYQQGEINESDLVDPYLAASEYSPGSGYQTWSLATLSSLGIGSPDLLSQTGEMVINTSGTEYRGILLSDGLPSNDTFVVGQTYNTSTIPGPQFVVTNQSTVELNGEFTLEAATNSSGGNLTNVTYRNVSYQTADLGEYKQLLDDLATLSAEIEARENTLGGAGGTSGSGIGQTALLGVIAVGAALLALRDSEGGGY